MAKAFTCDICLATYYGSPPGDQSFFLEFKVDEVDNRPHTEQIRVKFWLENDNRFPGRIEVCRLCLRKALKGIALYCLTEDKPIGPPVRNPGVYAVATYRLKGLRAWLHSRYAGPKQGNPRT